MNIYEKFDKNIDVNKLKADINAYEAEGADNSDRREVPAGNYEVKIEKLELKESKSSEKPMLSVWFKILNGDYKGCLLFMNQVVVEPFQVHIVKAFLKSLDSGIDIAFDSYTQFHNLLLDIHEAINNKLEYALKYTIKNGYGNYEITEVFDAN